MHLVYVKFYRGKRPPIIKLTRSQMMHSKEYPNTLKVIQFLGHLCEYNDFD